MDVLKMLAVFILALVFIELLPYIVLVIIGLVALLLKFAWLPVAIVFIIWLFSIFDK